MKNLILSLAIVILAMNSACVSVIQKQLRVTMDPLVGKSKEDVILAIGAPARCENQGELEICHWKRSYGQRGMVAVAPNPYLVTGSGSSYEAYDEINGYFKGEIMIKWDGYVQR